MTRFILDVQGLNKNDFWVIFLNSDKKYFDYPDLLTKCKFSEIKLKGFVDYAKFLSKKITVEVLTKELGFKITGDDGRNIECTNNGYCIFIMDSDFDDFWLCSHDATEGREIKTVEDLIGIDIEVNFKFN